MGKLFFNNKKRNLLILGYTCIMIIYFVFSTACIKAIKTPFPAISKPKIVMIKSFFDCYFCCSVDKEDLYVI